MNNMNYPVTVVMAAYNSAHCVGRAIESLFAQTYEKWNLYVVDDCSTDNTVEVIKSCALRDERITLIAEPRNLGPAHCRNRGIFASTSPLIAIMDSDDIFLPEKLRLQVEFLEQHPEVDVLGTGAYYVLPDESDFCSVVRLPETHEELAKVIYRCVPIHSTVMYRRTFIEAAGGYRTELLRGMGEDADLWLRTYRDFRFHNLQEPLVKYQFRRKPLWRDAVGAVKLLYNTAVRERQLMRHGWDIICPMVSYVAAYAGVRPGYTRRANNVLSNTDRQCQDG
ncbi:MAG: glycosyltransferase family 2 protein [Armatimonadetes bacterium]|nr:glycosyltransferase family 2 protein [Armatimonadota bacterium]